MFFMMLYEQREERMSNPPSILISDEAFLTKKRQHRKYSHPFLSSGWEDNFTRMLCGVWRWDPGEKTRTLCRDFGAHYDGDGCWVQDAGGRSLQDGVVLML